MIMVQEKIIQSLTNKFFLNEFEKRKIVFWYDDDNTVEDDLENLREELLKKDIKVHVLDNNFFATKKLLEKDDIISNYLIYCKESEPAHHNNWLLDIQLYSEKFETSRLSAIKSEFGITDHHLDDVLEKHISFFDNKERVAFLRDRFQPDWNEEELLKGFLSVFSKSKTIEIRDILRNLMMESLDEENNKIWKKLVSFGFEKLFWTLIKRQYGFTAENPTLQKFFLSLLLTHIKRKTTISLHIADQVYVNSQQNESEILLYHWMNHAQDQQYYNKFASTISEQLLDGSLIHTDLTAYLQKADLADFATAECINIFDKFIIKRIIQGIIDGKQDFDGFLSILSQRKTTHWYPQFKNINSAVEHALHLCKFSVTVKKPQMKPLPDLFKNYEKTMHLMDFHYRKFYSFADKEKEKDVLKQSLVPFVEQLYNNGLLTPLLTTWSKQVEDTNLDCWEIKDLVLQQDFYKTYVQSVLARSDREKIAVIISDALRYEIAVELKEKLNLETKGEVTVSPMLGVLPSCTRFGMAALLPHKTLAFDNGYITINNVKTEGIANREKILQQACQESIAFSYDDLLTLERTKARDQTRGQRVIYVYHNVIDRVGDDKKSEHSVFTATEDAINELVKMVKFLSHTLNLTNIIVTADHGFIYKRKQLENVDKLDTTTIASTDVIDQAKRYLVTKKSIKAGNVHSFSLSNLFSQDSSLFVSVPYGDLRFKQKGGGANFVHGGLSPQEIMIPVLIYKHVRDKDTLDKKGIKHGKVSVSVINPSKQITNNRFFVNLFQTQPVTDKLHPVKLSVALWDCDVDPPKKISDEQQVIADSTTVQPAERQFKLTLNLGAGVKNKTYYLRLLDMDPKAVKQELARVPFEVDLLIQDDFGDL